MRTGRSFTVSSADRVRLTALIRDRNAPQKHVWRAEIVLLPADGVGTGEVMRRIGKSKTDVWRSGQDLGALTAEHVLAAVEHRLSLSATSGTRTAATSHIRTFLRFLYWAGHHDQNLARVVPRTPHWRLAHLTLELGYGPSTVFFTWVGFNEMDEVTGDGHAELLDDGSIEITFVITTATRQSSRPNGTLLQRPARRSVFALR